MKLIPKFIQDIARYISADSKVRPTLSSVCITNDHLEATNSYLAVRLSLPKHTHESYPVLMSEAVEKLDAPILIPKKTILEMKFKKNKNFEFMNENALLVKTKEWYVGLQITDLETTTTYETREMKWHFPDIKSFYDAIIATPKKERIWVSIEYMISALQVMQASCWDKCIIETREKEGVLITPYESEWYDSFALVMPLKLSE